MNVAARRWLAPALALPLPLAGASPAPALDAPGAGAPFEEIIVTGSRIPQRLQDSPVHVFVLERDDIERASLDAIGRVLQQLPANSGFNTNTGVNNGGDGTTRMNLRGLGSERTLLLLNGRRFVQGGSGGDASVDLNMIPQALVERVEVVGVGASTVYGSDAIGGVVNLVTRDDYEGSELRGGYTTNDDRDGTVYDVSFMAGQAGERGHLVFGGELVDQDAVFQRDREYSRRTEYVRNDGSIGLGGSWATPHGWFQVPTDNALGLPGGPEMIYQRVEGSGNPPTASDFRLVDFERDVYDFAPINYLQTPSERQSIWLLGAFDVTDRLALFAEALIHHRRSEQLLAPALFYSGDPAGGAPLLAGGEPGIPADNHYNPFGVDLVADGWVLRRFSESVGRRFTQDAELQRYVIGARGTLGDTAWTWEISANDGRNETTTTTAGEFRSDRLRLALGPSGLDVAGNVVCGKPDPETGIVPADAIIAGCVPLDVFGGQGADGRGTITQPMLDYVSGVLTDEGYNEQRVYELVLRGDWGTVRENRVQWAVGASRRVESTALKLDAAKLTGTASSVQYNLGAGGRFTADEVFLEATVPLVVAASAAELLTVSGGLRHSDFSSFGGRSTYQAGVLFRPIRGFALRGSYGTVFRAPPLSALYSSNVTTVNAYRDPCGNDPTPAQAINCAAAGVPGGRYIQSEFDEFDELVGGNPDLDAESGDSYSVGATLLPRPALTLDVDYWRTSLENVITIDPRGEDYLIACADTGAPSACGRIQRRPDGSLRLVDVRHANGAQLVASGVDLGLAHLAKLAGGAVSTRLNASYLAEYDYLPTAGARTVSHAGKNLSLFEAFPHWRGLGHVEYASVGWSVAYQLQYIGAVGQCRDADAVADDEFVGCRRVADRWYQDVRLERESARGLAVAFAVRNLAGAEPPRVSRGGANTFPWAYPLLGRSYFLEVRLQVE